MISAKTNAVDSAVAGDTSVSDEFIRAIYCTVAGTVNQSWRLSLYKSKDRKTFFCVLRNIILRYSWALFRVYTIDLVCLHIRFISRMSHITWTHWRPQGWTLPVHDGYPSQNLLRPTSAHTRPRCPSSRAGILMRRRRNPELAHIISNLSRAVPILHDQTAHLTHYCRAQTRFERSGSTFLDHWQHFGRFCNRIIAS